MGEAVRHKKYMYIHTCTVNTYKYICIYFSSFTPACLFCLSEIASGTDDRSFKERFPLVSLCPFL